MEKYILPEKQIVLDSGLLVIYEEDITDELESQPIQVVVVGNACCLLLGKNHLVLPILDSFDCIAMTRRILIAFSKADDILGVMTGVYTIDDMAMGKMIAYVESGLKSIQKNTQSDALTAC